MPLRDPVAGPRLSPLPQTSSQIFISADAALRSAYGKWFSKTVEYANDRLARADAYAFARDQGKAEPIAATTRAKEALRIYKTQLRAQAIEHIENKRVLSAWVLEANRDVRKWLMEQKEERFRIIATAKASLEDDPNDKEAWEVLRAIAEAPGVIRASLLGKVISDDGLQRAYWQRLAPEDLKALDVNDAAAEVLEANIRAAEEFFGEVMVASEDRIKEIDREREIGASGPAAVQSYLEQRG